MHETESRALAAYRSTFGEEPRLLAMGPGRVNLIGEHTDYNGGFVLPCAIDQQVTVALGEGPDGLYSLDFGDRQSLSGCNRDTWAAYPRGAAWALADEGYVLPPFQAAYAGDVPVGAGLSSSAAMETATALGLDTLFALKIDRQRLALLCQWAENRFVGVNSGIMDQYASLLCEEGNALLLDCRSLDARLIPLDLKTPELTLLVCDTRTPRRLAETGYNERRAACDRAARILGIEQLRDATFDDLGRLSGEEFRRARHVVTENERVLSAVEALQAGDMVSFGQLMYASHASLRDDFEVSTTELDVFVETARGVGALGARLTGAGFGGSAIALIHLHLMKSLTGSARSAYAERGFLEPHFHAFQPSQGASVRWMP